MRKDELRGFWKQEESGFKQKIKRRKEKNKGKKRGNRKYRYIPSEDFFKSKRWERLRIRVFIKWGRRCLKCGSQKTVQVDHVKPRIKYPRLQWDFNNLQPLCYDCNQEKGWKDETDYRLDTGFAELEQAKELGYETIL